MSSKDSTQSEHADAGVQEGDPGDGECHHTTRRAWVNPFLTNVTASANSTFCMGQMSSLKPSGKARNGRVSANRK